MGMVILMAVANKTIDSSLFNHNCGAKYTLYTLTYMTLCSFMHEKIL